MPILLALVLCIVCFVTGYAVRGFVRRELGAAKAEGEAILADVKKKL